MTTTLIEQQLAFTFAESVEASQYDDWVFYRSQFNAVCGGTKAVDFVCLDGDHLWLIEVKDYRRHRRTKVVELGDEIASKVRDTLAGLVAASCNANEAEERRLARHAVGRSKLRVVLHLEQPRHPSRLFPRAVDPDDVLLKLKQRLKAIDSHPKVVDQYTLTTEMPWSVAGVTG
ncbi:MULTISPECIES: hypothetical protein [unclassified Halomonas]|uniref:hypothetical protein n=1 Tax=unclassified Halomonas TaxID=2609666 RepID=UPI001EF51AA8|nr:MULTISPECIES: hypothetical protein [unclassified Halomonas]MCG7576203.1 hypothetical protein [Halomonas sp. MMH1-48]MCG7603017.1 hypothetical protein [Halomonas sp. MM17-34]MCG7612267.1 hypothetical protein [Halomonas sp. MM17-29]MCG7619148.1 hypothetical protein [Halomonas sp. DSH1-27]